MGQFTRRAHCLFDVYLICLLALAPILFGFTTGPQRVIWVLCAAHFLVTILSDTPIALIRIIPFPVHGMIELLVAILCPFAPAVFGFWDEPNARHFLFGLGFGLFVLWLLTDYKMKTQAWNKEAHVDTGLDITAQRLHH